MLNMRLLNISKLKFHSFLKKIKLSRVKNEKFLIFHFKNLIFSKRILFAMMAISGMVYYRSLQELEEKAEDDIEKKLYKDKNFTRLYKHDEDMDNISLTISKLNLYKENLTKKLKILSNQKILNFSHDYNYKNEIKKDDNKFSTYRENSNNISHKIGFKKLIRHLYCNINNSTQLNKKVKGTKKEFKKIEFLLRNIINLLNSQLFQIRTHEDLNNLNKQDTFNLDLLSKVNVNEIISILKDIEQIKQESIFGNSEISNKIFKSVEEKDIFYNYIFEDYEEIRLRLLGTLAIFNKFNLENFKFNKKNEEFALNLCNSIINDTKHNKNESLIYYAKNFLINYLNIFDKESGLDNNNNFYFYSDYILEINKKKNFYNFIEKEENVDYKNLDKYYISSINQIKYNNRNETVINVIKGGDELSLLTKSLNFKKNNIKPQENASQNTNIVLSSYELNDEIYRNFDYDILFICGLNANFAKSWRIPEKQEYYSRHDVISFYTKGENVKKQFPNKNYQLWIPKMLEEKTFKDKNIRYIVSVGETKFFRLDHMINNIPDLSISELSERIYKSYKFVRGGEKPFILVCHSMGGLIAKNMLKIAELNNDFQFIENNKGIVFFSTPHLGIFYVFFILKGLFFSM